MKKILQLVKDENKLHSQCKKVPLHKGLEIGRELFKFLRQWNKQHPSKPGIGLAAPQLGIDASVCVIMVDKLQLVLVNPVILNSSDVVISSTESCLSLPGKSVQVPRHIWVELESDNVAKTIFGVDLTRVTGKSYEKAIIEAVCVQHEYDHLQGKLITDYDTSNSKH